MSEKVNHQEQSSTYKWFALIILTFVNAINYFDRQLLVILQEPIKEELSLSDTQLGLLTGLSFAIFYSVMGIPIARLADKHSRKLVISAAISLWSLFTALTGYVNNFIQILLVRMGVGVGEAGSGPATLSMITDYFPMKQRSRANAIYASGLYVGLFFSFYSAGFLLSNWGWRKSFIYLGLPGILLSILLFLLIREPKKGKLDGQKATNAYISLKESLKILSSKKVFLYVSIASAVHSFVGYGFANWMPSFLIRVHEMTLADAGKWLALSVGIGGAVGAFVGGFINDYMARKNVKWYLWLSIISLILTTPFSLYTLFSPDGDSAALCYFIPNFFYSFNMGATLTMILGVVKVNMRALTGAIYYFIINLIGMGLGPLSVGILSDLFLPTYGTESLRYALFAVSSIYLIPIYFYWKASKHIEDELLVTSS